MAMDLDTNVTHWCGIRTGDDVVQTYKGKESLSREEAIKAWKSIHIDKKTVISVCLRMNCSTSALYRVFERWGLPTNRNKHRSDK